MRPKPRVNSPSKEAGPARRRSPTLFHAHFTSPRSSPVTVFPRGRLSPSLPQALVPSEVAMDLHGFVRRPTADAGKRLALICDATRA